MATDTDSQSLQVELRDQKGVVFSGRAQSLTSQNSGGVFDILPQHAHFISVITTEVIIHEEHGSERKFSITQGVMRCFDNKVEIFTGLDSQVTAEDVPAQS